MQRYKVFALLMLLGSCSAAHAANYPISAGASTATIQSTINTAAAAGGGNSVTFAAGSYSITSQISIPCPTSALTIQGPLPPGIGTTWPITPTALLTSTLTNNWAFTGTACSVGTTFQYLQFNGGNPSGGGGGFLFVPPGMNNLTVIWNWFYGNSALQNNTQSADMFLYLGNGSTTSARIQNVTIQWNRFGFTGSNDCAALMTLYGDGTASPGHCSSSGYAPPSGTADCKYQGEIDITHGGGSCGAVGVNNNTDNLVLKNNSIQSQEQGFKFYEAPGSSTWASTNTTVQYNDFAGIHRIGFETQTNNSNIAVDSNDFHDPIYPNAGQWAFSLPQNNVNSTNNVTIANVASPNDRNGQPGFYSGAAVEFWGSGTSSNNLVQGLWVAGIDWGFSPGGWSANNNVIQMTAYNCYICNEEGQSNPPTQSGNVTGSTVSAITSVAPGISPSPGAYSSPLTVTLTDPGYTSGAGPQRNTSIYYTTDGSTPNPGSGTAQLYTLPIIVSLPATVKAVGMWGALNQPRSYPGGYGFVPSAVTTATYTASGGLTLSSVSIATAGGVSSINAGTTNQLLTSCHYSNGSSTSCNTIDSYGNAASGYNSSGPTIATVSTGGIVTGVTAGSTNLTATVNPAPSTLGTSIQNVTGATGFGYINEIYGVTGTSPGNYTPGNCHIIIPATTNWTAGKLWTCLLALGTPTTQNASALCSNSFTTTGTSWPGGDLIISMASCPALPPDQGYWVGSTTSQTTASPAQGFSNCNSSCSGAPPAFGSGSYAYRYVANPFGNYTSLPTTLTASGGTLQVSQYIELTTTPVTSANLPLSVTTPPPSLVSAYLTASSGAMIVGGTMQMAAKCHYTSGPDQDCTVADIYGDAVSAWLSSDPTQATVNDVGVSNPGLVTALAAGTPSITARIGTGTTSSAYPITITTPAVTLTGVSLSLTGGVTGLFIGATNQLKATCTYSDGSSDDCTTTDAHGNLAHSYLSTAPAHATVNATSGLVTGVAGGSTMFTAMAGSFTSSALPLSVFPVLSGIYTITVGGPVKFSGKVRF